MIFKPISRPGYQVAEGEVDFKAPAISRPGYQFAEGEVDFKAPEWVDLEAMERA